jgi:beta-lactam-binding protein with PASTA domain
MPPNFFQVPNLFGLSQEKAEFELEQAGLRLGKVSYEQNEDLIPFTVLDQSIKEDTVLESPKKIDITVSILDINDIFNQMMNK